MGTIGGWFIDGPHIIPLLLYGPYMSLYMQPGNYPPGDVLDFVCSRRLFCDLYVKNAIRDIHKYIIYTHIYPMNILVGLGGRRCLQLSA